MTTAEPAAMRDVVLRRVPVALWARSQEASDELIREFTLIASDVHRGGGHDVPDRLIGLIDELTAQYGELGAEQEAALHAAAVGGVAELDLHYLVPSEIVGAVRHLGEMLDEADEYCQAGQHLLTLAMPADLVAFRRWFLTEFERQVAGEPPVSWPEWRR